MKKAAAVQNEMRLTLPSHSVNESVARAACAVFLSQLDPTVTELSDVKCAVSEAVTNCIVHAYPDGIGEIYIHMRIQEGRVFRIEIRDLDIRDAWVTVQGVRMEHFVERGEGNEFNVFAPGANGDVLFHAKAQDGKGRFRGAVYYYRMT